MTKNKLFIIMMILLAYGLISCSKDEKRVIKVGLISGLGGFNDYSFSQAALSGFNRAIHELTILAEKKESFSVEDLNENIKYFGENGFDLVITLGIYLKDPVMAGAEKYPETDFLLVDYVYPDIPSNVVCASYAVDQVSFPAGVLAAFWAWSKDPVDPVAGFVSGPDTVVMNPFSKAYINGIKYFNDKYNTQVGYSGRYAISFSDSAQGALLAEDLINTEGAEIIYTFAGMTGNGSLSKVKELNKWGIGVDVDQYYSLPWVKGILLTSCMKKIDNTVYDIIVKYNDGDFEGGKGLSFNLANDGVGLAPYHELDTQVPDSIKTLINQVIEQISKGTLSTGVQ